MYEAFTMQCAQAKTNKQKKKHTMIQQINKDTAF